MSALAPVKPFTPPLVKIETQYRRFLARRWFEFVARSAVFTGVVAAVSTYAIARTLPTLGYGFLEGLLGFPLILYPALAARRALVTAPSKARPPTASMVSIVLSTFTSSSWFRILSSYITLAAAFTTVYCQVITWADGSRDLGFFSPTPRHPWHLNEKFVFLLLGNTSFFAVVAASDLLTGDLNAVWPDKKAPLFVAAQRALRKGVDDLSEFFNIPVVPFAQLSGIPIVFYVAYFWQRKNAWYLLSKSSLLRPFLINFVRSGKTHLSYFTIFHLYFLALASLALLRLPTAVLNTYVTQPLSFDVLTKKSPLSPDRYLLTALKSQDRYYLHFTLMELVRVSHDASRRRVIFADVSKLPVLTHELWQELLLHLGHSYQLIQARGSRVGVNRPITRLRPSGPDPHAIQPKQADVFRPVIKNKSTIGATLQSVLDGPIRPTPLAVVQAEKAVLKAESQTLKRVEGLQKEVMGKIGETPVGGAVLAETRGVLTTVNDWRARTWARRHVQSAIPDPISIVWITDIFATLAVASADEDTYGRVQQVLPATLEAIVRLRSGLISFENELVSRSASLGKSGQVGAGQARALIGPLIDACERSVLRVGRRFGKSLGAFRFPPPIALALAEICKPLDTVEA